LDDCDQAEDSDGDGVVDYGPRLEERDDDQDGFIECDYYSSNGTNLWTDISTEPVGWGDCQDDDADVFPGAPELCSGEVENCDSPEYGTTPPTESDEDGDGYVECDGFIAITWEGSSSVIGGGDCNDSDDDQNSDGTPDGFHTFPGAAENIPDPNFCAADSDLDGDPDCVRWSNNNVQPSPNGYECDYGVFLDSDIGPDFVLIAANLEPDGRYELTNDYYMMTTEVTRGMFETLMNYQPSYHTQLQGLDYPVESVSYYEATQFANALSTIEGLDSCYNPLNNYDPYTEYSSANIYDCPGYRIPTEGEWEYAARSGVVGVGSVWYSNGYIWTDNGGGQINGSGCGGISTVGNGSWSLISDYAWYCSIAPAGPHNVARLLPNGFGLYDMIGNVSELTNDWANGTYQTHDFPYGYSSQAMVDPVGVLSGTSKIIRGGDYNDSVGELGVDKHHTIETSPSNAQDDFETGFRLVKTANP